MHQIAHTFTRLLPAIEFADSVLAPQPDKVCVLGVPPAVFAPVHSPSLINTWYDKLQAALRAPLEVEQRQGHRRVQVLGTAIFDFAANGMLQVYVWDFDENDRIKLTELPGRAAVVQSVPYQALWMERFTLGATRALVQRHPGEDELCRSYVGWIQAKFLSRCWDQETQDRVRYQIAVELDVGLYMNALLDHVPASEAPLPLRADFYNQAVQFGVDCQKLEQEAPQLLPLYRLMAGDLTSIDAGLELEPTARMQRWLAKRGLLPATWRLLCHVGTQWITEFMSYFDLERQSQAVSALEVLLLAQAFGAQQLVPSWLLQALIQLGGNPNAPQQGYVQRLDDLFPLCARLGHLVVQADVGTLAWMQEQALHLFSWASRYLETMPCGYTRRATFRGLIRKVDAQQKLDVMRLSGSEPWRTGYKINLAKLSKLSNLAKPCNPAGSVNPANPLTPDGHEVQAVILDSPLAIWTEGRDMRHCADNYIDRCARGDWIMVSLRSSSSSRSLATVAFEVRTPAVKQVRISGFANGLVSPEVRALALECQRQLQSQRRRGKGKLFKAAASSTPTSASTALSASATETKTVRSPSRLK